MKKWTSMRRYFFDLRHGDSLAPDEEGMELASVEAAQEEAAQSLADMAKGMVTETAGSGGRRMAIEVRDGDGPVMKALFTFEPARRLR